MTQSPAKKSFFNRNVDLMNGPIFKSLLVFMLPILVSCLFQQLYNTCLLYTSPSPRDRQKSRMPSSA